MPNAIKPDYFKDLKIVAKKEKELPVQDKEEQALADMSEMAGWKVLEEHINFLKISLDSLLSSAMTNGASYEEIGQKTIVTTLTKSYLDQVIAKVSDARDSRQPE